jgi:hypothetical protein
MTSRISKLAVAAALAAALPALAAAHDRDGYDRDGRAPAPVYTPAPPPAQAPPAPVYRGEWRQYRGNELRARELAEVRGELARLDAARADFHARNAYRPGLLRRYDRDYFARRAELERREHRLERIAWR